ncbi:OmpA family protein [candidate division KSB1 bacterium]|nr:OmpA family protein [candidate division KSB1 bacterium]
MNRQQYWQLALICWLAILMSSAAMAQYQAEGLKGGFGIGVLGGQTDLEAELADIEPGAQGRVFIRYDLFGAKFLQGDFGLGFGTLNNENYHTKILPIDYRLLLSPLRFESWNLYLYGGVGALYYKNIEGYDDARTKSGNWTAVIPLGLGLQFRVGEQTAFEISGGYNMTMKDDVDDYLLESNKDNYVGVLAGLTYGGESGDADSDKDGLINKLEKDIGTDRKNADTDGDLLSDGAEYNQYKTNPLIADSDGDGLTDGDEILKYKTDPLKADSDGDGLTDADEINVHKTDPKKADSDGDGLKDSDEINVHKTNPLESDSDDDGLSDGDEISKHKSNPLKVDSDGDGLDDGDEVTKYKSSPIKTDTDGDGVNDNEEVNKFRTNPAKMDTDGGTIADGIEINRGTDPLNGDDDLPKEEQITREVGTEIVMEGIVFASGSSRISAESRVVLDKVAKTLMDNPTIKVEVQGHTDNTGRRASNIRLSQARANAVCKYLESKGIAADRMVAKGMGPDRPVASNDTAEGRQQNRRITFTRTE